MSLGSLISSLIKFESEFFEKYIRISNAYRFKIVHAFLRNQSPLFFFVTEFMFKDVKGNCCKVSLLLIIDLGSFQFI